MFESILGRFRGMSWAEMTYIIEEEEEIARVNTLRELTEKRRALLAKGEYELEEGEILE